MRFTKKFWAWYEKNYTFNVGFAAGLFILQLVHLVWLAGFVIAEKLLGQPLFVFSGIWEAVIILIDYTEIPAIITVSLVYIAELRKRLSFKSLLYLLFLNLQWLHLFWITDEFVLASFSGATILPLWLAWVAILIDYLEVPVIIETIKKFVVSVKEGRKIE